MATIEYEGLVPGLVLKINLETGKTEISFKGILQWDAEKTQSEIISLQKELYVVPGEDRRFVTTVVIEKLLDGQLITA